MNTYQESLKVCCDNKNTMDYAIETAKKEARQEGKEVKYLKIAKALKIQGGGLELISKSTGLTVEQIRQL